MRLTAKKKSEIETAISGAYDALRKIKDETGLTVSMAAFGNSPEYAYVCIYFDGGYVLINERKEIDGFFNGEKWKTRKRRKKSVDDD